MPDRFVLKIGDHLEDAETKRYYNERVFSEIAPRYDFISRVLSFGRDAAWKRTLVSLLPSHESPVCVDLACGTGDIAFLLAGKYPRARFGRERACLEHSQAPPTFGRAGSFQTVERQR